MPLHSEQRHLARMVTRRILFRLHWLAGLSAGLVLAVVGATGALIGFKSELLGWLNPQYRIEGQGRQPLPMDLWIASAHAERPELTPSCRGAWAGNNLAVRVRLSAGRGSWHCGRVEPLYG